MGRFSDFEHHFRCFREEVGAMLDFNIFPCLRTAPVGKLRQLKDMAVLYTRHGFLPESYYNYKLYEKVGPLKERVAGYVSDKDRYRWLGRVNENYGDLLRNKWFFHQFFGLRDIPTPTYYGNFHHRRGRWTDGSSLCSGEDILAALDKSAVDALVIKPVVGSGGNKVMIFSDMIGGKLVDSSGLAWTAAELVGVLGKGDYIFEECVDQHPELSLLYPHSLNTVRITTLNDGEQALPWAAVLRVGTAKSGSVDNWGRGGIECRFRCTVGRIGSRRGKRQASGRAAGVNHRAS